MTQKIGQIQKLVRNIWPGPPRSKKLEVNWYLRQHIKWNQITKKMGLKCTDEVLFL